VQLCISLPIPVGICTVLQPTYTYSKLIECSCTVTKSAVLHTVAVPYQAASRAGIVPLVPIGYEAGWASEQVCRLWSTEKPLVPPGNQTLAVQLVARGYTD
jgi:hypothetical protein